VKHYLWKARPYYRQVAGLLFLGSACGIVCNMAVVLPAMLLGRAIDVALAMEQGDATLEGLVRAAAGYVAGTMLYFVARMGKRWWLRTAVRRTIANVRSDALRGVLSWPMEWLHREAVGDIMARIMGDSQVFGTGFNESTTELLDTWLFSVSLIAAMLSYAPLLTLLVMIPVPVALLLSYFSRGWVRKRTNAVRLANADLTTALQEHLSGVRVLRLFGRTDKPTETIERLSRRLEWANLAEARLQGGLQPVYSIVITLGVVLVVWLGGQQAISGAMTIGSLVAFMQLYLRFVLRGHRLPLFFNRLQSAGVAWGRLERLLTAPPPIANEPNWASFRPAHIAGLCEQPSPPPRVSGGALSADLQNVSFRYPGATSLALDHVSLAIPAGSLVAVTGPVGSGKSALLRALMGIYGLEEGRILIDGRPVDEISPAERAARLGYLPQDPGLFSGTVLENMAFPGARPEEVVGHLQEVISIASLAQDLEQFPDGLNTQIGESGVQVSGGQRQRIALARALSVSAGQPPGLLLLDDPFAFVDVETEGQIMGALHQAFGPAAPPDRRATIVLCSHRLASFQNADLVVVLDRGRIVAQGSHDDLLAAGGLYARIYGAQHQIESAGTLEGVR